MDEKNEAGHITWNIAAMPEAMQNRT